MNAIAPCFGADVKDWVADSGGFAEEDLVLAHQSECEGIDQRIKGVGIIEGDFAADSGYAKSVSIMSNTAYDTSEQGPITPAMFRVVQRTKTQTIHGSDRSRAHREDVAQDPADTSCCSLKRLDE